MGTWISQLGTCQSDRPSDANAASLGYTGARLSALTRIGVPVQPGFIVKAETCNYYHKNNALPDEFDAELDAALEELPELIIKSGQEKNDLTMLVVKASSKSRIAGVTSPIFHLGLNRENVQAIAKAMAAEPESEDGSSSDKRAAGQLTRFLYQFSEHALNITPDLIEDLLDQKKQALGLESDADLSLDDVLTIYDEYRTLLRDEHDTDFPEDIRSQLRAAIIAAIQSWMSPRAVMQRQIHDVSEDEGLSVIVRQATFGDFDNRSGQGYFDTRNRKTGAKESGGGFGWGMVGEQNARTSHFPLSLAKISGDGEKTLFDIDRDLYEKIAAIGDRAERYFGKSQRLGLVVQSGDCWVAECVDLKLTALAELKISVDLAREGIITKNEAITRIDPSSLEQLLHPSIDPDAPRDVLGSGVPASPGAASGEIVFTAEDAVVAAREGRESILVRVETSPEDVHGMQRSEGILTVRGGMTSHAAVIARGMGIPCVCGARSLRIDLANETLFAFGQVLKKGDVITLDGAKGEVLRGTVAMQKATLSSEFQELMAWTDDVRRMEIRTNAEAPSDVSTARQFGAQGVGLCRTEHMFFDDDRAISMREMILADTEEGRRAALDKLLPMQRSDFIEMFEVANGQPITIRLLDPPLHEFLPKSDDEIAQTAKAMGVEVSVLHSRIEELSEFNPMLGHRGCRLAISYPEITEMQARAIMQAAIYAGEKTGAPVVPEIMVPLVALKKEVDFVKGLIQSVADEVMEELGAKVHYLVGSMIELPRAVIRADAIAEAADFFSFGTNDLTQMTFGISRDDASPFLKTYRQKTVIDEDPFVSLDLEGVGELISLAVERGRASRPDLMLGVCGEHGGDPVSIKFFDRIGLDYVSCSPFRVPIARLAAAQASIEANALKKPTSE